MAASTFEETGQLLQRLRGKTREEGFASFGIAEARLHPAAGERLREFIALGRHGDMDWLAARVAERESPEKLWPAARSAIVLALHYGQTFDSLAQLRETSSGTIASYALNRDYHDLFRGKLKRIARWLAREGACDVKVFVDTAPLLEKPLAQQAGLGWQGKHSNLVSQELGSWFFIGTILTTLNLPRDRSATDHCGRCQACLDICPTRAFPAPYQLDARRCISYLTIEHKGHIAREFRKPMGNRIYGCDDCLAVCPWNKFARLASDQGLVARDDLKNPPLSSILALDDTAFRKMFAGSPIKRTGRDRFVRNCLIAAGNSRDAALIEPVQALLDDASPIVRATAVWALQQLDPLLFSEQKKQHLPSETDQAVREEWLETA